MGIEIKNLGKSFKDNKRALNNVSIEFKSNQITGLIGFNGSGKTTTFNIMSTFIENHEGEVLFDGQKINQEILSTISYLSAGSEPKNPVKVRRHLVDIGRFYGLKPSQSNLIINKYAEEIEFTQFLDKPIKALSKGNQQKIKVITVMLNPKMKYLFLDEPFDGLDPIMVEKVCKIIKTLRDVTIILTSHRMEVVNNMCTEFFVLKDGVLVDARKTDDKTIELEVNGDVPLEAIEKMKGVLSVKLQKDTAIIILENITYFKAVNKKLIASPKYVYSSLRRKDIATSVFEGYGV